MKLADLTWLGQRLVDAGRLDAQARARGVPTAEYVVVRSLLEESPATISELTRRTGYAQSRVSTAVAGLVERGWVILGSDPADGRRTLATLTDRVEDAVHGIETGDETRTLELMLAGCTPRRRQAIIDALEDLHRVLRDQETVSGA